MSGVIVFRIARMSTGPLNGGDHSSGFTDRNHLVAGAVKSPDRQLRNSRRSRWISPTAQRNRGSKDSRLLRDDIPRTNTTVRLPRNIYTSWIDIEFCSDGIKY